MFMACSYNPQVLVSKATAAASILQIRTLVKLTIVYPGRLVHNSLLGMTFAPSCPEHALTVQPRRQ